VIVKIIALATTSQINRLFSIHGNGQQGEIRQSVSNLVVADVSNRSDVQISPWIILFNVCISATDRDKIIVAKISQLGHETIFLSAGLFAEIMKVNKRIAIVASVHLVVIEFILPQVANFRVARQESSLYLCNFNLKHGKHLSIIVVSVDGYS